MADKDASTETKGWAVYDKVLERYVGGVTADKPNAEAAKAKLPDDSHAYEVRAV